MKVALVSDTHDNLYAVEKLIKALKEMNIKLVLHAGDIIAPFTLKKFQGFELKFVFGNNDGERAGLASLASQLGFEAMGDFGSTTIFGKRVAILHGTNEELVKAVASSGLYDIVLRGHTHKFGIAEVADTLVVNPGEVCGYLTGEMTFVVYDAVSGETRAIYL